MGQKWSECFTQTQIYCIWQPGGWINIKNNKIKNYIIIKNKSIDCSAMSGNYLGRKLSKNAGIEWFWQSVGQVAVVASISPPLLHVALAASNVN